MRRSKGRLPRAVLGTAPALVPPFFPQSEAPPRKAGVGGLTRRISPRLAPERPRTREAKVDGECEQHDTQDEDHEQVDGAQQQGEAEDARGAGGARDRLVEPVEAERTPYQDQG